jgi:hypothetical protein
MPATFSVARVSHVRIRSTPTSWERKIPQRRRGTHERVEVTRFADDKQCNAFFSIVGLAMLMTAGCSSVSICLQQEKGICKRRTPGAKVASPNPQPHRAMNGGLDGDPTTSATWRGS